MDAKWMKNDPFKTVLGGVYLTETTTLLFTAYVFQVT